MTPRLYGKQSPIFSFTLIDNRVALAEWRSEITLSFRRQQFAVGSEKAWAHFVIDRAIAGDDVLGILLFSQRDFVAFIVDCLPWLFVHDLLLALLEKIGRPFEPA